MNISDVTERGRIPALLNARGLTGWGVEIGAFTGDYSDVLLSGSLLSKLFTVDPWHESEIGLSENNTPREHFNFCIDKLWKHYPRSVVIRQRSVDAAQMFADRSLDFVYIDANHDYAHVAEDIAAWWPKMNPGGIFAGHDYNEISPDLRRAVDEFVCRHGLALHVTECDFIYDFGAAGKHKICSWLVGVPNG